MWSTIFIEDFLESFARQQEYGLPLLVSTDEKVNLFLTNILSQIEVIFWATIEGRSF